MSNPESVREFRCGNARVHVYPSVIALGMAASERAAGLIGQAIQTNGRARIMVATGNSQIAFIDALTMQSIPWNTVEVFHMDEYCGLPATHPASFRHWIQNRLIDKVHPAAVHYIAGDAPDLDVEIRRYAEILSQAPIDVAFVGFGENGHIAFNDPPNADFDDPLIVKRVQLDDACRKQQAGEGHFPDVPSVPSEAITVTCKGLINAQAWVCCVPEKRKAQAVHDALEGPVSVACPASIVQRHPNADVLLDEESASLLKRE